MHVRSAEERDISAIEALYREMNQVMASYQPDDFLPVPQAQEFLQELVSKPEFEVLLAEDGAQVCGMAVLKVAHTPPYTICVPHRFGYLMDLCVKSSCRGKGIGKQLLDAAKGWIRQRGLEYLELSVLEENKRAAELYRREGFRDTLHRMRYTPEEESLEE